jgi:hypothetical protein
MDHFPLDTAPRDGKLILLHDAQDRTSEVGRWSAESGSWVLEDGTEPGFTPAHWSALPEAPED